jgi:hypothetical protein
LIIRPFRPPESSNDQWMFICCSFLWRYQDCLIVLVATIFSYVVFTSSNSEWHRGNLLSHYFITSYFHLCSNIMGQFHMLEDPFGLIVWTYGFNYVCGEISMPCDNVTDIINLSVSVCEKFLLVSFYKEMLQVIY